MKNITVGIDLGTTNSAIAGLDDNGLPRILKNSSGALITPSCICFVPDGEPIVGLEAKHAALLYPEHYVFNIKRRMGVCGSDGKPVPYYVGPDGKEWTPEELSALVLKKMVVDASTGLGFPIADAVITVPAYFRDPERHATDNAGKIAGLRVRAIMNEPVAGAIAFGLDRRDPRPQHFLIVDLGGGTTDVSIVRIENKNAIAIATDGERSLGGTDFDLRVLRRIAEEAKKAGRDLESVTDPAVRFELHDKAERLKMSLSAMMECPFHMNIDGTPIKFVYRREEFEAETRDLLDRVGKCVENVLKTAHLEPKDISDTVLIGGATRMPMVSAHMDTIMGKPPRQDVDADTAVAQGAAMAAAHFVQADGETAVSINAKALPPLNHGKFVNVTAHALGCAALDASTGTQEEFAVIIDRNTPLPATCSQRFRLRDPSQTTVLVRVFQGQSGQKLEDCLHIDDVLLDDIPPAPITDARIEVRYSYDRNGIIHVTVIDHLSHKFKEADISHNMGLSDAEVAQAAKEIQKK